MDKFNRLIEVIATLRSPEGCPWDKEQTHATLIPYCVEEAYEVVEAIENKNPEHLKEELGDLLLQVLLHAQIASENNDFSIDQVVEVLTVKMIERHPHVFAGASLENSKQVVEQWEKLKKPKAKNGFSNVSKHAPQLMRAIEIGSVAHQSRFDWESSERVFDKINEEVIELKNTRTKEEKEEELGDVLFSLCQWARFEKINPELAIKKANDKFIQRYEKMIRAIEGDQKKLSELDVVEMEKYWKKIKSSES